MYDEPRVSFLLRRVAPVVVDPVAVERQRGKAEEEHVVGDHGAVPHAPRGGLRLALRRRSFLRSAIDEALLLLHGHAARPGHRPANRDEDQRARAAALLLDPVDDRILLDVLADPQRLAEPQPAPRPHAPRKLHGREEPAALRMAVAAKLRLRRRRSEQRPVETGRDGISVAREWLVAIERRIPRGQLARADRVRAHFAPADPARKLVRLAHASTPRTSRGGHAGGTLSTSWRRRRSTALRPRSRRR